MVSRETTRPLRKLVPAVALGVSALLGVVGCSAGQVAQTAEMEPAVNGNAGQVGNIMLRDVMIAFPENGEPYHLGEDAPLQLTIVNVGGDDDRLVSVRTTATRAGCAESERDCAGQVEIIGNANIPGRSALEVVLPGDNPAAPSSEPSSESSEPESTGESQPSSEPSSESPSSETSESESPASGTSESSETSAPPVTATLTEEEAPDVVGMISLVITGLTNDLPYGRTVDVTFQFEKAGTVTITLPIAAPATPRPEGRDEEMGSGAEGGH
jgi:copper(I)-binding protein